MRRIGELGRLTRKRLDAMREIVNKMPHRSTGIHTQSQTIDNLVSGAIDNDGLMKALSGLLYSILIEYQPNRHEDAAYGDPDLMIEGIATWAEQRKKEGWKRSDTRIDHFLESVESQDQKSCQH